MTRVSIRMELGSRGYYSAAISLSGLCKFFLFPEANQGRFINWLPFLLGLPLGNGEVAGERSGLWGAAASLAAPGLGWDSSGASNALLPGSAGMPLLGLAVGDCLAANGPLWPHHTNSESGA